MHRNYCSRASIPTNKTVRRQTTNKHKKNDDSLANLPPERSIQPTLKSMTVKDGHGPLRTYFPPFPH